MKSEPGVQPLVPPLVPVITRYDRTIEEVARAETAQHLDQAADGVRSVGPGVFVDSAPFAALVARVITERNGDVSALAEAVAERPEVFGQLRGKAGLLEPGAQGGPACGRRAQCSRQICRPTLDAAL